MDEIFERNAKLLLTVILLLINATGILVIRTELLRDTDAKPTTCKEYARKVPAGPRRA